MKKAVQIELNEESLRGSIFKYSGSLYIAINLCKYKNPYNGKWLESVLYAPILIQETKVVISGNDLYAREKSDFESKFRLHGRVSVHPNLMLRLEELNGQPFEADHPASK